MTGTSAEKCIKIAVGTSTMCIVFIVKTFIAYVYMFRRFPSYDDEGMMLIAIKQYLAGNPLYDSVFSRYGPFFFLLSKVVFGTGAMPVSHDAGRLLTCAAGVFVATVFLLVSWRLTRSVSVLLVVVVLTFDSLSFLSSEPSHPRDYACS